MTAARRALALGCFALAAGACMGNVGGRQSDAAAPPQGGAAGTSLGPGEGGAGGVAGASGVAGTSGSSGGAGSGGGAGTGPTGAAGTTSGAGTTGAAGTGMTGAAGGAGATGAAGAAGGAGATGDPAGWVPALIGVGYGGIRIVSRDGGKSWGDRAYETTNGGDDDVLLRAVAYGKGIWVATGWKLWTSNDGVHWTDHGKLADGPITACSIVEGLAYKDGFFFAVCTPWNSPSAVYRSSDGVAWTKYANIGDTGGHLSLTCRDGTFVSYGDNMTSFQSDDALTWTVMSGVPQATYCEDTWKSQTDCKDSSWFDGAYLRADWQGKISRSTDGKTFTAVYNDDQKNTLYQSRAVAAGYVAPK
jgi:hypothetical protein